MSEETAHNKHIGKMAALTPKQRPYEIGSYYPAGTFVKVATTPNRRNVACNGGYCP